MTARTVVYESLSINLPADIASDVFIVATAQGLPLEDVVEQMLAEGVRKWITDHPVVPD